MSLTLDIILSDAIACNVPRDVFQCPVLFSFWRIRHAWHKNIIKKCPDTETRVEISRHLGQAVDKICRKQGTATLFEGLMEHFVNSPEFIEYFRAVWSPRIGYFSNLSLFLFFFFCLHFTCKVLKPYGSNVLHVNDIKSSQC